MISQMNDELKKQMKEMMKEVMQEQLAEGQSSQGYPKPKTKSNAKSKNPTNFDETRSFGVDKRDPRTLTTTWPCMGEHMNIKTSNNRFGKWSECEKCGLRMSYTPAVTAPSEYTKCENPNNVTEALHKLRTEGWTADEVHSKMVKSAILIAAKEKITKKVSKTPGEVKGKPKTSPHPKKEASPESSQVIESEDEVSGRRWTRPEGRRHSPPGGP